ncbi:Os01g0848766 [Oryza sativa Japonica Group]|uniref:Os01g0848766 protein n=1 Tax=Oryza sativa subsp. japonica TaxID=39947 RepID=A0A0P0VAE1_ORYSJ|nr:hypothetical protein EE612_006825 [Oryza sativa]BAS75226.1 Os01g0848766 [Oryza sativa Japonica Group]
MVPELPQPPLNIVEGLPLCYVEYKKCSNCTPVISTRDCTVSLLTCRVPYLSLDSLPFYLVRVANSTPMVDLDSRKNSLRVKRERMLDLPTPESPMRTILNR